MRLCAFRLIDDPLLPVVSIFFIPAFIATYVFSVVAFSDPYLCSYKFNVDVKLDILICPFDALNIFVKLNMD